jgi:hypothetical protein
MIHRNDGSVDLICTLLNCLLWWQPNTPDAQMECITRRLSDRWSCSFLCTAHASAMLLLRLFFFLGGGVGQTQAWMPAFVLAHYAFPRWYEFGDRRWNDVLTGENRRTRRKSCPSATLSSTNPTWIDPGANAGLRGERPATNDLSHGTALTVLNRVL